MKKQFITLLFLISNFIAWGQTLEDFKTDFKKALVDNFSEKELNNMFQTQSTFLTPHSDVTQLMSSVKGERIDPYPLIQFKNDTLYTNNIRKLVASQNKNQRILAYLVIAGAGDKSFENTLLKRIKEETDKGCLLWSGMALLYLNTSHTTPMFDFLVENETFGDAHMLPLYMRLNKDSLQQTAYLRINSDKPIAKILAVQLLAFTPVNPKSETLIRNAVKEWDFNSKGYAIFSLKELQIGDLLELLKPLLDNSQTRRISLEALANSPTESDKEYLVELVNKQDSVSEELLDCFYQSKKLGNIKYWLKLLNTKQIPNDYYFAIFKQPLIKSDSILIELQTAIQKIKNEKVLSELIRALQDRTDSQSVDILMNLLNNENSSIRYWAAESLKGNHSEKLKRKIPDLLRDVSTRTTSLTDLAIDNNLDTLQTLYENIYKTDNSLDWQRSSIDYLSTFPKDRHKKIFKKILENKKEDPFIRREAAIGLGRLKDQNSVDLIITACKQDSEGSDYNAQPFLSALGMIKGDKAKKEIEKYKDSREQLVRELVDDILKNW